MKDLEEGRMVPGQMLAETNIAVRFGVGRNAVREAMQQLGARGVIDLSRHRSPTIRLLDKAETSEILAVATRGRADVHAVLLPVDDSETGSRELCGDGFAKVVREGRRRERGFVGRSHTAPPALRREP